MAGDLHFYTLLIASRICHDAERLNTTFTTKPGQIIAPQGVVNLDAVLTLEEAAALWRITPELLSARSKGKNPMLPGVWLNRRVVRFHPRMMFAQAARKAGVEAGVIAAAFSLPL